MSRRTAQPATPLGGRPHAPGYGIKTGEGGLLDWAWADERLARSKNYWIATTRADGRPHVMPVWGVWLDGVLYFGSSRASVKARNIARNPATSAHLESGDEAVIIEGVAEEVSDRALLRRVAAGYAAKYPDFAPAPGDLSNDEAATFALRPKLAFAWLEKAYPETATRWRFEGA